MKRALLSLVLMLLVIGLVAGCAETVPTPAPAPTPTPTPTPTPAPAPAESIQLTIGMSSAPYHVAYKAIFKPWADELEQLSGGRVKVTIHHSAALGSGTEAYAMLEKGVCDVTDILPAIQAGRFPLQDVYGLPYMIAVNAKDKNGKLIRETILEKYMIPVHFHPEEVKIMWTGRYLPKALLLRDTPVRDADGAKGIVISHPGGRIATEIIKSAFLAAPETMLVSDFYLSQERGVIDASFCTPEILLGIKMWEVTKYITLCGELSPGDISLWAINRETWNSLPPDIQKIIDELSPKYKEITVASWIEEEQAGLAFSKEKGAEVIPLTPEMDETWKERTKHIADDWAKEMDSRGLPGTEVVNEIRQLVAQSQ